VRIFSLVFCASTAWAQLQLSVEGATSSRVDLRVTGVAGSSFGIQRRIVGGRYEPFVQVSDAPSSSVVKDQRIDAMVIYQYRATAGSIVSNEVTVGPPAAGYTIALPTPKIFVDNEITNFARSTAMELDSNGDPAFLYSVIDPNFTGGKEAELWFLHWDRAHWRWKAPVKVTNYMDYRNGTTLARDPMSSTWATVSESESKIELLISTDDGATWTPKHRLAETDITITGRAVALFGGNVFWLHGVGSDGFFLLSGALADDPKSWKREKLPMPEPYYLGSTSDQLSIAVDSQGRPGMTYFGMGPDYNVTALYWRPGMATARKIQDSDNVQNDFHSAEITYSGAPKDQAKFVVELNRQKSGDVDPEMWLVRDTGSQMEIQLKLPNDGGRHSLNAPVSVSFDANGQGAVLLGRNGGNGTEKCGVPKLSRGGPTGAWKTCSPDVRRDQDASLLYGLSLRHAVNNKLYGGFAASNAPLGPGIVLWREP
jgi:hypothetical protein